MATALVTSAIPNRRPGALPAPWQANGTWAQGNDALSFVDDTIQDQLLLPSPPANLDIWIGLDVDVVLSGTAQAAIVPRRTSGTYYYGELYDNGAGAHTSIVYFDGTNYIALNTTPVNQPYPTGPVTIFSSSRASGSPAFTFVAGIGTMTYNASSATASYNGADLLIIALSELTGAVRYIAIAGS